MTIADAIQRARSGDADGFACLFENTIPHVRLAAAMLGCPQSGTAATQIYTNAMQSVASLRSPSDLRVWMGRLCYAVLLQQPEQIGISLPFLEGTLRDTYELMKELPRTERLALLLLCGEGCSAPQAADILSVPDIEIKRAMRRARQTIAAQIRQIDAEQSCNTAWLIEKLAELRQLQSAADAEVQQKILFCVQNGEDYLEPEAEAVEETGIEETVPAAEEVAELPDENHAEMTAEEPSQESAPEEKSGFFQKLFRSRRFGA